MSARCPLGTAERVGKVHLSIGPEQPFACVISRIHIDYQPGIRQDFGEGATRPVLFPGRRTHTNLEWTANMHLHPGLRNRVGLRTEPAFDVIGGAPGLEYCLSPGVENA